MKGTVYTVKWLPNGVGWPGSFWCGATLLVLGRKLHNGNVVGQVMWSSVPVPAHRRVTDLSEFDYCIWECVPARKL